MPTCEQTVTLARAVLSLADASLRVAYLADLLERTPEAKLAPVLDELCTCAEQDEPVAREVLVALVDALNLPRIAEPSARLRAYAERHALLALDLLLRSPQSGSHSLFAPSKDDGRLPNYGRERPLTLGERKWLARRPDRDTMPRLLADPHPDVIRALLCAPSVTEMDVVRLAARRPCRPEVLAEIGQAPRWLHRSQVRMALILNPDTPQDLAARIAGLLLRQELRRVVESTFVPMPVRDLCREHLQRRASCSQDP